MVANDTKKWVDALPDVVNCDNRARRHSYHSERPKDVVKTPPRSYCKESALFNAIGISGERNATS
jgi:hypothetical protein